ncbi:hypothetical protein ACWDZ4_12865 [Streptomyces sp. NPDC003016]
MAAPDATAAVAAPGDEPYLVGKARQWPCPARRADGITLCLSEPAANALVYDGVPPGRGLPLVVAALAGTRGAGRRGPGKAVWCGFTLP